MKTRTRLWVAAIVILCPCALKAQCVTPLNIITFDTTVVGSGNAFHTFTFPKFDPSLGTLVEVNLKTEVTLRYRFQLENRENIAINNYRVRVVRDDEISGPALQTPLSYTHQANYGPYALAANDGVAGSGPDYIAMGPVYAMNHQLMQTTVYNTADFLGSGNVSLDYTANTYSIVFGSVTYNFNGTAEDTARLIVTYRYCNTWFLPADITAFTAARNGDETINIMWTTPNERKNRVYTIEKSHDGRNFSAVTKLNASNGNYQYTYTPAGNETGKIIFRLKQTETDGTARYSALRIVDIKKKQENGIRVYPNPSNGSFSLLFSNTKRDDWEVSILTLQGQIIGRYQFNRALVGKIDLQQQVAKGMYIIKAVSKKTQEQLSAQLFIR